MEPGQLSDWIALMRSTPLLARRLVQLVVGLVAYGAGIALMVRAAIGVPPWDVLAQGVSRVTGLDFGLVTNLIGLGVLARLMPQMQVFFVAMPVKSGLAVLILILYAASLFDYGADLVDSVGRVFPFLREQWGS